MYASGKGNDWQLQHSLGVVYNFGKKSKKITQEVPVIIETPIKEAPVIIEESVIEVPVIVEAPVEKIPVIVEAPKKVIVLNNILFETNESTFKSNSQVALNEYVNELKSLSGHILIKGHTDNTGTKEYNQDLSLRRAEAVKKYLVQQGIDASIITIEGRAASHQIHSHAPLVRIEIIGAIADIFQKHLQKQKKTLNFVA